MFNYFILGTNNFITCKIASDKEQSHILVSSEIYNSVPNELRDAGQYIYKYVGGVVVKDISDIDYSSVINEFQSYVGSQLSSQFIAGFDGDLRQHEEELKLVALGLMAVNDMAMSDTDYNTVIAQKMVIRRAVKQLKTYAGYLTESILLLKNIALSNALDTDDPSKLLVPVFVVYAPVDYSPVLSGIILTLNSVDYADIVKGDFFFKCDSDIVRVNVFSDIAITDLSSYTSVELICWVGVDSVKYAVEG